MIFSGVTILQGVEFRIFLLIFERALGLTTVQRYCAACDSSLYPQSFVQNTTQQCVMIGQMPRFHITSAQDGDFVTKASDKVLSTTYHQNTPCFKKKHPLILLAIT